MDLTETGILEDNPALQLVLAEYRAREVAVAKERAEERRQAQRAAKLDAEAHNPESEDTSTGRDDQHPPADDSSNSPFEKTSDDRWLQRVSDVEGVPDEELSSAHGLLIAWGFIKFKLIGREGMVYQLSTLGIQAAEGRLGTLASDAPLDEAA